MGDTFKFASTKDSLKGTRLREGLKGWGRFIDEEFVWGIGDDPFPPEPKGAPMTIISIDYKTKTVTLNTPVVPNSKQGNGEGNE